MKAKLGRKTTAANKTTSKGRMEEVYAKAAMLFKENGYLNTSVNQIAQELGIQKGSLYYYITDKETLLFDILDRTMDNMLDLVGNLPSHDLSPDEKLKHVIRAHIVNAVKYLNEFSALLHDTKYLPPDQRKIILLKRKQYEKIFVQIIEEGISKKIFVNYDTKMVAYMILGSCNWLYQWFSPKGSMSSRKIAEIFFNVFLEGLLAK
jgi:AcrR family transcriptional regulator